MNKPSHAGVGILLTVCLSLGLLARAQNSIHKETSVTANASGTFEVKLTRQGTGDKAEGSTLGRMTIDKQLHGDLEATSKGEMLTAVTDVKGSAGYVAIGRISGKLHGRSGNFVLQHSATMTSGAYELRLTVVPDSGRPTRWLGR